MLIRWIALVIGLRLSIGMLMILLWKCRIIPIFGMMVTGRISLLLVGLRLLVLVFYLPASDVAIESSVWGVAEEYGDARLEGCRDFCACSWCSANRPAC